MKWVADMTEDTYDPNSFQTITNDVTEQLRTDTV